MERFFLIKIKISEFLCTKSAFFLKTLLRKVVIEYIFSKLPIIAGYQNVLTSYISLIKIGTDYARRKYL